MWNSNPDALLGCYICGEEVKSKDTKDHVTEKHPDASVVQFYNVYHIRMWCPGCDETEQFKVPPGLGADWIPGNWHSPCPNKKKEKARV